MKTCVVLECGSKAQVILDEKEWRLAHRLVFAQFKELSSFTVLHSQLNDNSERTVITSHDIRSNEKAISMAMYNASYDTSIDYESRLVLSKVNVLLYFCLHASANLAFNFLTHENEMHVFGKGIYYVGDLFELENLLDLNTIRHESGIFELENGGWIANFKVPVKKVVNQHGHELNTNSQFICMIRRDYVDEGSLNLERLIDTKYLRVVEQMDSFRCSVFKNPLSLLEHNKITDCYSFGSFSFDIAVE